MMTTFASELKIDELESVLVPIYSKFYSHEEILGLIQFYESPLGKKHVSVQPQVSDTMMPKTKEWMTQRMVVIQQKLQKIQQGK